MKLSNKRLFLRIILYFCLAGLVFWYHDNIVYNLKRLLPDSLVKKTVSDVLTDIGADASKRLLPWFERANVPYPPPQRLALLGFKAEKRLELWAETDATWTRIRRYRIFAASGVAGPKLREGDRQVPEGIYRLNFLNPNSSFHLSMQINYPNDYDRRQAAQEQRTNLGGEIFIHGNAVSIGCLAIGDEAIEELFVLVATIGMDKVTVILAPQQDMQTVDISAPVRPWVPALYADIRQAVSVFSEQ
jgi:hypothetical protein